MDNSEFEGLLTPNDGDQFIQEAKVSHSKNEAEQIFGTWHLYLIIVIIIALNLGVLLYVRHRMKTQVRDQMNSSVHDAVSQYFALSASGEAPDE